MMGDKMSNKLDAFFKSFADSEEQLDYKMAHVTVGEKVPSISTGSYALNDALSSGGLPKGRIIQYYGPPGSGKTLMALIAIVEAQKEDPDSQQLFIDAEQTFDPNWAEVLGVDTSRVIVVDGDTAANGRKCFEMLLGVPKEDKSTHVLKGKSKEGLLDKISNKEFNINLIILDSLGAIIPPGEDTAVVGKMNMALMARFLTTTFKKLTLEVSKAQLPFIVINHKRDNMDPYGADHTYSGGNTYSHTLSANVYFEAVQRKDSMILDEKENKVGHPLRATIEKSKFGPWPRKCEFKVNFSIGVIDKEEEIAQLALDYGVVEKPNNVSHVYGEKKWVGFPAFCAAIKEDEALASELLVKIDAAREAKMEQKRQEQKARLNKVEVNTLKDVLADDSVESEGEELDSEPKKRGRKASK
jgi:recombination protein RecA